MTPERWQQIETVYHAARARPAGERDGFLSAACGSDDDLRVEVLSLLRQPTSGPLVDQAPVGAETLTGWRFGSYVVRDRLGAGGMGEVYRAFDSRLRRDVAVKLLPPAFASDQDRAARFDREARILASLNHPHIAAIYNIEDATTPSGIPVRALVLELVEGETLSERIARGPLPIAEACRIAIQIAAALESAHDKGIVHRDLKPANVKITPAGAVKVLDFGLAAGTRGTATDVTGAPTMSEHTMPGTLLGTARYMSPEQARGLAVDRRTDVWAFGCVLLEMISGHPAFAGDNVSDILARILEREPDWSGIPADTPATVRRVIRRALVKDPEQRLHDIADARLELQEAGADQPADAIAPIQPRGRRILIASIVAAAIAGAGGAAIVAHLARSAPTDEARGPRRFTVAIGSSEVNLRAIAVSPDGKFLAYIAGVSGLPRTYLRSLVDNHLQPLAELPNDGTSPFFSPDSQWVAYFDRQQLWKRSLAGGGPVTVADAPTPRGGTWGSDGTIVFAPVARSGLRIMRPGRSVAEVLTTPNSSRGETSHRFPMFIPDSHTVLFIAEGDTYASRAIESVSIDTGQVRVLMRGGAVQLTVTPSGHLLYLEESRLVAVPFDRTTQEITGAAATMIDEVGSYALSADGTLFYAAAPPSDARIATPVWVDRNGATSEMPLPPGLYEFPRLSPDGRRMVINRQVGADRSLWMFDLASESLSRFTFGFSNTWPVWSPDGRRVLYGSNRAGTQWDVYAKRADGAGVEEAVVAGPDTEIPRAISAGDLLIYQRERPEDTALMKRSMRGEGGAEPVFSSSRGEMMPDFSPDGRWITYVSPESGQLEVYVSASDGSGSKWQVSTGGTEPMWSADGRELFFRTEDRMLAVNVTAADGLSFGKPRPLFTGMFVFANTQSRNYDVTRDGSRFLMLRPSQPAAATPINAVLDWLGELQRRVPTGRH